MPAQKSKKPVHSAAKVAAKPSARPESKVKPVAASKSPVKVPLAELKKAATAKLAADLPAKKKPGRPPKVSAESEPAAGAKRGRKPKTAAAIVGDLDLSEIEADLAGEPVAAGEKVKPLRMKISKAKERALM